MSITLNNSDFQCLQDQLVDLKTKNYELTEKTRRAQADFEAAKAKVCTLQLKLEEQERDFQVTSTTLRREIESVTCGSGDSNVSNNNKENKSDNEDYKLKYKKLLHKAKELQQRYEKSVEIVQQLDTQNKSINERVSKIEDDNNRLREELEEKQKQVDMIDKQYEEKLAKALEEQKLLTNDEIEKHKSDLEAISAERNELKNRVENLVSQVSDFDSKLEVEAEERRIQERKGLQIVKELKRQLALEKNRTETLQRRLENLLKEPPTSAGGPQNSDLEEDRSRLSLSSSTNENSNSSNGNGSRANQDANSVGSWSFVPVKTKQSSNQGLNETLSLCSIDSEDRETVQQPCDSKSEASSQRIVVSTTNEISTGSQSIPTLDVINSSLEASSATADKNTCPSLYLSSQSSRDGLLIEEQAALVDRLTKLQHDKWMLEEKLSYMEQANSTLTEDLANKSDIIKQYFVNQAIKSQNETKFSASSNSLVNSLKASRRTSYPEHNISHLLPDNSSLKKVVNFLKERSQISNLESEAICRETTKKMQLMLEETLIKCLKLQENLDFVTSKLDNK